jgi:hypothetical protein
MKLANFRTTRQHEIQVCESVLGGGVFFWREFLWLKRGTASKEVV